MPSCSIALCTGGIEDHNGRSAEDATHELARPQGAASETAPEAKLELSSKTGPLPTELTLKLFQPFQP